MKTKPAQSPVTAKRVEVDSASKALEEAIAKINKDYGEGSVMRMGEGFKARVDVAPTGNLAVDHALGVGGLPKGRVIEVYGPESSGKTTLCLSVIAGAQKRGERCAFIDVEHAFDPSYATKLGVRVPDLIFSQPDSGNEALTICQDLVRTKALSVVVIDSVAALISEQEKNGEIGDAVVGAQARLMSSSLRKLCPDIRSSNTCCIFTNQLREKIGVMFGNPETTPGGKALKFYASIRIDIRKIGAIKRGEDIVGNRTRIKVVKNKVAPPHKEVEFDLIYGEGIAGAGSLVDLAIQFGVFEKRGSWISYLGTQVGQGREACKLVLQDDTTFRSSIENKVKEKMQNGTTVSQAPETEEGEMP